MSIDSATVGCMVATIAIILSPSIPDPYADISIPVNAFITNVMATKVYRMLKLELLDGHVPSAGITSAIQFGHPPSSRYTLSEPPTSQDARQEATMLTTPAVLDPIKEEEDVVVIDRPPDGG